MKHSARFVDSAKSGLCHPGKRGGLRARWTGERSLGFGPWELSLSPLRLRSVQDLFQVLDAFLDG